MGSSPWRACVVGHHAHVAYCQRLPETFVIAEQKQLVFLQRAAQRAAELISPERRNGGPIEEVARVQIAIAQKLEQRSVQTIGAGLRDHADLRAGALAIFRAIGIGEHIEFADGIDAQQFSADAAGVIGSWLEPVYSMPFSRNRFSAGAPAVHRNVLPLLVLVSALFRRCN